MGRFVFQEFYEDGGVKKSNRIIAKYFAKYATVEKGPEAHKIVDILRCTFGFGNIESIYKAVIDTVKFFRKKNGVILDENSKTKRISENIKQELPDGWEKVFDEQGGIISY